MSVLSFPRIYFHGFMEWDPPTANNNDYLPTYAQAEAGLDWDFLAEQDPPITPENFAETFRPWAIDPHPDTCPAPGATPNADSCSGSGTSHMASRWDYFGSGASAFYQNPGKGKATLTSGGDLAFGRPAAGGDPILGKPVFLAGDVLGGRPSAARLVDVNPGAPWSSQVFFASVGAGDTTTFLRGPRFERMYSGSFFVPRSYSADLIIAGAIGVVFQTALLREAVELGNAAASPLLSALAEAMAAPDARGLMLRFAAYSTLYYQNGVFNDYPEAPDCDALNKLYEEGKVFHNPAYSRVAGVFGVWKDGELATVPGGRLLVASGTVTPDPPPDGAPMRQAPDVMSFGGHGGPGEAREEDLAAPSAPPAVSFGNALAEVDLGAGVVSLDFGNTVPESDAAGGKFPFGPLAVGVETSGGGFYEIGSIGYDLYGTQGYLAKAGIVDVPFADGVAAADVEARLGAGGARLAVRAKGTTVLRERPLVAATDARGVYVDQCHTAELQVQVRYRGGPPPPGTRVKLAQYYPYPLTVGSGLWALFGTVPPGAGSGSDDDPACTGTAEDPYLRFLDGDVVPVEGDTARVRLAPEHPGFPVVQFYPFLPGEPEPQPQPTVTFGFTPGTVYSIGDAYYTAARAMPFDNALVAEFRDRWNGTGAYQGQPKYDRLLAWKFVYGRILYVYDMLYPVMDQFVPLGDLAQVEASIDRVLELISASRVDTSTVYMPVTRELSAGKRLVLETWGELVKAKYPQKDLPPIEVPCDYEG
ncbi:MAG TPA: hypothetical protein VLF66_08160 [Thermoanaerobaculia bacterium]|nr:hypothetical protein [Thermoanaerobaculia bacterium]